MRKRHERYKDARLEGEELANLVKKTDDAVKAVVLHIKEENPIL